MKGKTCCVTGHRDLPQNEINKIINTYLDYIYVNQIGEIVKPGFVTAHFSAVLKANNLPRIRFHDLRHPYVKPTTKKFITFFEVFRAAS